MRLKIIYILPVIFTLLAGCGNNNEEPLNDGSRDANAGISSCKADCGGDEETDDEITEEGTDEDANEDAKTDLDEDEDSGEEDKGNNEASEGDEKSDDEANDNASYNDSNSDNTDNGDGDADNDNDNGEDGSSDKLANVEKAAVEISSYDMVKKKVVTAKYDIFYLPGKSWRVVCEEPCGLTDDLLKKKVLGADNAIEKLIEFTGVDALAKYAPIEINDTSSSMCGDYETKLAENGYVTRYFSPKFPAPGSYMCLWDADDQNLVLPLNDENAQKLESQVVLVHEYSHILFYGRVQTFPENFEDFVKAFSFYISGFWDGNGLEPENFPKITDACDPALETFANDIYNLCTKCGFQFSDIKTLFQMIDSAKGDGPAISEAKLKEIFDAITGHDSVAECGLDWLAN